MNRWAALLCMTALACTSDARPGAAIDGGTSPDVPEEFGEDVPAEPGEASGPAATPDLESLADWAPSSDAAPSEGLTDGSVTVDGRVGRDAGIDDPADVGRQALRPPDCKSDWECLGPPGGDPCLEGVCADGECAFGPSDGVCNDGDPCTLADKCKSGACSGVAYDCQDCQACDGKGSCLVLPGYCWIDGTCHAPSKSAPGVDCLTCAPNSNPFGWTPLPVGAPCDDGDACTAADTCADGVCMADPVICPANGACLGAECVGGSCASVFLTGACEDGDACTGPGTCLEGACAPGTELQCDDANPCTSDVCDPATGCAHVPDTLPCDDGNVCTADDTCVDGNCSSGPPLDCDDDDDECTIDGCHPLDGCIYESTCCGLLGEPCPAGFECTQYGTCESADEVYVPAGPFWMGCVKHPSVWWESCDDDEYPVHEESTGAYAIDRLEVTVVQFEACFVAGACSALSKIQFGFDEGFTSTLHFRRAIGAALDALRGRRPPSKDTTLRASADSLRRPRSTPITSPITRLQCNVEVHEAGHGRPPTVCCVVGPGRRLLLVGGQTSADGAGVGEGGRRRLRNDHRGLQGGPPLLPLGRHGLGDLRSRDNVRPDCRRRGMRKAVSVARGERPGRPEPVRGIGHGWKCA